MNEARLHAAQRIFNEKPYDFSLCHLSEDDPLNDKRVARFTTTTVDAAKIARWLNVNDSTFEEWEFVTVGDMSWTPTGSTFLGWTVEDIATWLEENDIDEKDEEFGKYFKR